MLSASQWCRDVLLLDVNITDILYHIECYRPYVLKASHVKEVAQEDDDRHSGAGHHEKKCEWVVHYRR
jgi:hypothetical protein